MVERHDRARLRPRLRQALLQPDQGLRQLRLSRKPRRLLRPAGLRLVLDQAPSSRGLLLRPAELAADGLLRPGPDRRATRARTASRSARSTCPTASRTTRWRRRTATISRGAARLPPDRRLRLDRSGRRAAEATNSRSENAMPATARRAARAMAMRSAMLIAASFRFAHRGMRCDPPERRQAERRLGRAHHRGAAAPPFTSLRRLRPLHRAAEARADPARRRRCVPLDRARSPRRAVGGAAAARRRAAAAVHRSRRARADGRERAHPCREMPLAEHVVADYQTIRLSIKGHPMQFLRDDVCARGHRAPAARSTHANDRRRCAAPASCWCGSGRAPPRAWCS